MKVLILNRMGNAVQKDTDILPRIGDQIDMGYLPHPRVSAVLLWPSKETLTFTSLEPKDCDAIITLD